jgi:catechol 2,3-dioxygenase-like lactoylglutathione lyase family enzyme
MAGSGLPIFTPHHVGIIVSDLDAAMNAYIGDLGYSFYQFEVNDGNATLPGSSPSFSLWFGLGQLGVNVIELIQPVSGTTVYSQHLADKGPGVHHLAFSTTDLAAARKGFAAQGYKCLQDGTIRGLVDFSYYDVPALGCVVEPLQLSCDLVAFLIQNAKPYVHKST